MDSLLAVDVGGGTQDILLYEQGKPLENCIQLVLPAPTVLVGRKINLATIRGKTIFLYGRTMGGGPSVKAIKEHITAGFPVYATTEAALTIHDNLEKVQEMGIILTADKPEEAEAVRLGDLDLQMLEQILLKVGYTLPAQIAVAVQDHGYSPRQSNRIFRFRLWEEFMKSGGKLPDLAYRTVPSVFTRMQAIKLDVPDALLMDTCGAALLGALSDSVVREAAEKSIVTVLNLGNQHSFAALVHQDQVLGLFEHHTAKMTAKKARGYLERLCGATLTNKEVQDDGGHGCIPPEKPVRTGLIVVTGPRRALLSAGDYYFAAPQGNMMLMGCFGLIAAANSLKRDRLP
ncbi:MAG: DUF1786 domain-containing protein [Dethiobacter sp.]|jgi:uncharacterized protein (DUF1786 family)|nr:DUF1786 domain-containing protein [Dethiobacter sp.]MBS3990063.1 DUF1786 domain-containing protein [Dethiobacter sp.]